MATDTSGHTQNGTAAAPRAKAWRDAVDAGAARARKHYGAGFNNRINKARHYIIDELIEVDGQFAYITSESYPETHYTAGADGCDCQDAEHTAPQGMCAHRLAWDIYRGACKLMREPHREVPDPIPDPYTTPAPPLIEPLAEAPISICMKGTLAGMAGTMVTIRGRTMDEIVARAAQVKAQADHLAGIFDAAPVADVLSAASEAPSDDDVPADGEPPVCPDHGTEMRESNFGGWYCTERIDEDQFCKRTFGKPKGNKTTTKRRRR